VEIWAAVRSSKRLPGKYSHQWGDMLPRTLTHSGRANSLQTTLMIILRYSTLQGFTISVIWNDDLRIFDKQFEDTCNKYSFVVYLAQRKFEVEVMIHRNELGSDYPFRLKDRCRMDTDDYSFQEQFGTGLLSTPNGWQEIDDWLPVQKCSDDRGGTWLLVRLLIWQRAYMYSHAPIQVRIG